MKKKSIFGLLLILSMVAAACGGGSLEGEEVFITGALVGNDAAGFQQNFDSFTEETGIIVSFQGSDNYEQEVQIQMVNLIYNLEELVFMQLYHLKILLVVVKHQ